MATCNDCENTITWAEANGRHMPFDEPPPMILGKRKPLPAGVDRWVVINGRARRADAQDEKLHREMVTCHWETCSARRW